MLKFVRWWLIWTVLLLLLGFSLAYLAQPVDAATAPQVTITWLAPTKYEDGSTIAGAITYQLYVGASGAEVKYGNPVTSPPYLLTTGVPGPGQTVCVQVTATVNGVESARTPEACATMPFPRPAAPVQVTVTVK